MSEQVGLRLEPDLFQAIEEWRREQRPVIPGRTEAIRHLIRKGLELTRREAGKKATAEG